MKTTYDLTIRSNRTDYKIKDRLCSGTRQSVGYNEVIFELDQTRNWFARDHFSLKPDFKVLPEGDSYEYVVTSVSYHDKRPYKTILKTVRL